MPDVGQALLDANLITSEQLQQAQSRGGAVVANLVQANVVSEEQLVSTLARVFDLKPADLANTEPDPDALSLVPEKTARGLGVIPLKKDGAMLLLATSDPSNDRAIDRISRSSGLSVKLLVAGPKSIENAYDRFYNGKGLKKAKPKKSAADVGPSLRELDQTLKHALQEIDTNETESVEDLTGASRLELNDLDPPVVRLVNGLLLKALKMRASDLHVETLEEEMRVRFRIDGVCRTVDEYSKHLQGAILSRIKILGSMDIAEKRKPQDGRINLDVLDREIDVRVSALPGTHGESIVMRLLDKREGLVSLERLGFGGADNERFHRIIKRPNGLFLVTGPTGSGKTTSLYAALQELNQPGVKIITAENPVEYHLLGVNQCQVHHQIGLDFARILRAMLRQAPNIILVGEIRDHETAAIAIQAALTGHLVFSTLHTNDAPSALTRLIDMGVAPFLVSSSVAAVMAQRLIRVLCARCKKSYEPTPSEMRAAGLDASAVGGRPIYRAVGCDECRKTGYRGRIGIFELLELGPDLREAVFHGAPAARIRELAIQGGGLSTLRADALGKVVAGHTSLEEVVRVLSKQEVATY